MGVSIAKFVRLQRSGLNDVEVVVEGLGQLSTIQSLLLSSKGFGQVYDHVHNHVHEMARR
jgi:hypothetical protein